MKAYFKLSMVIIIYYKLGFYAFSYFFYKHHIIFIISCKEFAYISHPIFINNSSSFLAILSNKLELEGHPNKNFSKIFIVPY